ncbi:hypothetical protein [Escherichia coli]|uniref:hypothetical protein n=1 Tax=Escherichia coli TaxID=562 RepID=UPI00143172EB|nr:hypothetical protein [Escherichia coli]HAH3618335.1 hypothetical protein [Escherichia coli]HBA6602679.1 hypothetical protein [Escherichia coli]
MDAIVARQDNHHKTLQTERLRIIPQFGEINQSDIDLILFYRGEYEKYFDSLKDGDECLSFKDFIEYLRSENGSGFKEGKVISKY